MTTGRDGAAAARDPHTSFRVMDMDDLSDVVLIALDRPVADSVLDEVPDDSIRRAPSVRGLDPGTVSGAVLVVLGSTADLVTLIVNRGVMADFARRVLWWAARGQAQPSELKVSLRKRGYEMNLELKTDDDTELAQALTMLADLEDGADASSLAGPGS